MLSEIGTLGVFIGGLTTAYGKFYFILLLVNGRGDEYIQPLLIFTFGMYILTGSRIMFVYSENLDEMHPDPETSFGIFTSVLVAVSLIFIYTVDPLRLQTIYNMLLIIGVIIVNIFIIPSIYKLRNFEKFVVRLGAPILLGVNFLILAYTNYKETGVYDMQSIVYTILGMISAAYVILKLRYDVNIIDIGFLTLIGTLTFVTVFAGGINLVTLLLAVLGMGSSVYSIFIHRSTIDLDF